MYLNKPRGFIGFIGKVSLLSPYKGENSFHIFDIEKTVVDIVYYRNKIGEIIPKP